MPAREPGDDRAHVSSYTTVQAGQTGQAAQSAGVLSPGSLQFVGVTERARRRLKFLAAALLVALLHVVHRLHLFVAALTHTTPPRGWTEERTLYKVVHVQ